MFKELIDENEVQINVTRILVKVRIATAKEKGMDQTTARIILNCKRNFEQWFMVGNWKKTYLLSMKSWKIMHESKTAKAKGVEKTFWGKDEQKWTIKWMVGKQRTAMTGHKNDLDSSGL